MTEMIESCFRQIAIMVHTSHGHHTLWSAHCCLAYRAQLTPDSNMQRRAGYLDLDKVVLVIEAKKSISCGEYRTGQVVTHMIDARQDVLQKRA